MTRRVGTKTATGAKRGKGSGVRKAVSTPGPTRPGHSQAEENEEIFGGPRRIDETVKAEEEKRRSLQVWGPLFLDVPQESLEAFFRLLKAEQKVGEAAEVLILSAGIAHSLGKHRQDNPDVEASFQEWIDAKAELEYATGFFQESSAEAFAAIVDLVTETDYRAGQVADRRAGLTSGAPPPNPEQKGKQKA